MATIAITELLGTGQVAADRVTLNSNFVILQDAVNALEALLNSSTSALAVSSVTLSKGANPITTSLYTNEGSGTVAGNFTIGETLTAKNLTVTNGLTVSIGNFTLSDATKKAIIAGGLKLSGMLELVNFGTNFIDAALADSYEVTSGTTGTLATENVHSIMLDFSSYDGTASTILSVKLPAPTTSGQVIVLMAKIGSSAGTHFLKPDNIGNMASIDKLVFTADYCSVLLVAVGSVWAYFAPTSVTHTTS